MRTAPSLSFRSAQLQAGKRMMKEALRRGYASAGPAIGAESFAADEIKPHRAFLDR